MQLFTNRMYKINEARMPTCIGDLRKKPLLGCPRAEIKPFCVAFFCVQFLTRFFISFGKRSTAIVEYHIHSLWIRYFFTISKMWYGVIEYENISIANLCVFDSNGFTCLKEKQVYRVSVPLAFYIFTKCHLMVKWLQARSLDSTRKSGVFHGSYPVTWTVTLTATNNCRKPE